LDGIFYQLKNGYSWCDLPSYLPPYSTVLWHYKQWRTDGVLDQIMATLHAQVRQQVKKTKVDKVVNHRLTSREEHL